MLVPEQKPNSPFLKKDLVKDAEKKGYDNFIDYLLDHPLPIADFAPLTREEIYNRNTLFEGEGNSGRH